eukprot:1404438-Pleurochrysis_carterae.AAC.4
MHIWEPTSGVHCALPMEYSDPHNTSCRCSCSRSSQSRSWPSVPAQACQEELDIPMQAGSGLSTPAQRGLRAGV